MIVGNFVIIVPLRSMFSGLNSLLESLFLGHFWGLNRFGGEHKVWLRLKQWVAIGAVRPVLRDRLPSQINYPGLPFTQFHLPATTLQKHQQNVGLPTIPATGSS